MSVSIDKHPADEQEGADESARSVLAGWLDDYAAGRCERADMEESFLSVCGNDSEAAWDALALLDQYQRLGRIDAELARALKSQIAQLAVGAPKQQENRDDEAPPVNTGTRWRQTVAERDHDTDDIEVSSTAMRDDPVVQRPAMSQQADDLAEDEDQQPDERSDDDDDAEDEAADAVAMPRESLFRDPSAFERKWPELRRKRPKQVERADQPAPDATPSVKPAPIATPAPAPRATSTQAFDVPVRERSTRPPRPATGASAASKRILRDRYELLSVLARGNSSTVYKALDRHRANLSESARYVAIKVLDANFDARPDALAQLEREFHQAQSLSHPNIGSVFDLDRDGSTYFIVMELLEGDLLTNILRRLDSKPMKRKNALALIGSIGAALAHAHRRDIAHGDLKPRNVMITSMGEVRVLEFGFARSRALQAGEVDSSHEAVSIGTPAYASAERVHGFEPDPSDDVYSLACIAYELLCGRHPYGGRSALLARAHGKRPQRISGLSQRQWHALQRALAWDRAERKIDVVDLLAALGTSDAAKEPVPPELLSLPDDLRARRRRMVASAAMVVGAVALATYFVTRIPPPLQTTDLSTVVPAPETSNEQAADRAPPPAEQTPTEEVVSPAETTVASSTNSSPQTSRPGSTQATAPSAAPRVEQATTPSDPPQSGVSQPVQGGAIQFAKDTFVVTESDSAVSLDVTRTGPARGEVAFRWTLRNNSAEAGTDFAAIGPGVERIPAGSRSVTILIPLVSDSLVENTELFLVELEPIDEAVKVGEVGHAAVIVVDDD